MKIGKIEGNDYDNLIMNDAINAFRIAVNGTLSVQSMVDGFVDEYEDENGIDAVNSINELYNSTGNYYSLGEGDSTTVDTMEYSSDGDAQTNYVTNTFITGNTKLLLHFNGEDGTTVIPDATNNHTVDAIGTAHIESDAYKWGSTSLYLDGNSDYLELLNSSDWDIVASNSDNWTIDFWVKHTDHVGTELYLTQGADTSNCWLMYHYHGGGIVFGVNSSGSPIIETPVGGEITDTNWHHIALCKVADEYAVYLDGTQVSYVQDTSTVDFTGVLRIGAHLNDSSYLDGYMDEVRIQHSNIFSAVPVVGTTDTITIPTSRHGIASGDADLLSFSEDTIKEQGSYSLKLEATQTDSLNDYVIKTYGTPIDLTNRDTVKIKARATRLGTNFKTTLYPDNFEVYTLLLHLEGADEATTTTDATGRHSTITFNGNAKIDNGASKFGSTSLYCDGTGDYLSIANSDDFQMDTDFTMDFWMKFTDKTTQQNIVCLRNTAGYAWKLKYSDGGSVGIYFYWDSSPENWYLAQGSYIVDTNWHHIAVTRNGNTFYLFVDGVLKQSAVHAISETFDGALTIGRHTADSATYDFKGYIDEFRLIRGKAMWTSTFTPETSAYSDKIESDIIISATNTWETKTVDISGVANADKDNITGIGFEIINADAVNSIYIDDVYAYANPTGMTLISENQVAQSVPDDGRIIVLMEEINSITLNTDLKAFVSRDDGSTWAEVTLEYVGDYGTDIKILFGEADLTVSGVGSGTNAVYKLVTYNSKNCKFHGTGLSWR